LGNAADAERDHYNIGIASNTSTAEKERNSNNRKEVLNLAAAAKAVDAINAVKPQ